MERSAKFARLVGLALAISLVAASCGSSSDTAATGGSPAGSSIDEDGSVAGGDETGSDASDASRDGPNADEAGAEAEEAGSEDALTSEHFFPDIDVVNISSGEEVNLAAELAGGDKAVLLWFYAPH